VALALARVNYRHSASVAGAPLNQTRGVGNRTIDSRHLAAALMGWGRARIAGVAVAPMVCPSRWRCVRRL